MRSKCSLSNKLRSSNSRSNGMRFVFFYIKFMHISFFLRCMAYYDCCCCCCTPNALTRSFILNKFLVVRISRFIQMKCACTNPMWLVALTYFEFPCIYHLSFYCDLLKSYSKCNRTRLSTTHTHTNTVRETRHSKIEKVRIIKYPISIDKFKCCHHLPFGISIRNYWAR